MNCSGSLNILSLLKYPLSNFSYFSYAGVRAIAFAYMIVIAVSRSAGCSSSLWLMVITLKAASRSLLVSFSTEACMIAPMCEGSSWSPFCFAICVMKFWFLNNDIIIIGDWYLGMGYLKVLIRLSRNMKNQRSIWIKRWL